MLDQHKKRIERDSLGDIPLPKHALYGAQTQRAINNFPVSGQTMPEAFIRALLQSKATAATVNALLQVLPQEIGKAIHQAVDTLLADKNLMQHFPLDIFQTGSGTSTNMNANEVIATLAMQQSNLPIHPNDHVNLGQSSNDSIPSTIHISAAVALSEQLLPALYHLTEALQQKANSVNHIIKTGRTHLMDAMPIRLSQSLNAWAAQILINIENIKQLQPNLQRLAQGGTAVGTGVNAHPDFAKLFCKELSAATGVLFVPADNVFSYISSQDTAVALSGQLKTTAVSLMKIANDLRWMNSGPLAGLGEIELETLQPGSSIMPGKVNPVIPESTAMVAAQVIGNDTSITIAGQSGNFELNVMLPLIAYNLLNSIQLLSNTCTLLADKAIATFKVNEKSLAQSLALNPILATALNPIIGYEKAAEIAKQAYKERRPIISVAAEQTELSLEELTTLLDPKSLV
ncbi:class II fumarate hydratase [Neptunomonas japonica]|uniref:Fumarate hydratase class II n=1 Tax=Neptunomonas japonica JAMM 1380 TaxID=1441457 RepID=A0A7R6PBQ1_9GAMM|nr:class II fumarate hydratase [Neptunomonas japonica]BBB30813.1 fumarate hydratase, class II [Neptunomonas japonica JAMM 1380]